MASYSIYRISLEKGVAEVFKIVTGSDYEAVKETRKFNMLARRFNYDYAYIYQEDQPCQTELVIPVL